MNHVWKMVLLPCTLISLNLEAKKGSYQKYIFVLLKLKMLVRTFFFFQSIFFFINSNFFLSVCVFVIVVVVVVDGSGSGCDSSGGFVFFSFISYLFKSSVYSKQCYVNRQNTTTKNNSKTSYLVCIHAAHCLIV